MVRPPRFRFWVKTLAWGLALLAGRGTSAMQGESTRLRTGLTQEQEIADRLGLEPSEWGRLRSNPQLHPEDRELNVAVAQLEQRPYRLLPSETPGTVRRIQGYLEFVRRHEILWDDETVELYECLVRTVAGTEIEPTADEASFPAAPQIRLLTRQIPEVWHRGPWVRVGPSIQELRWDGPGEPLGGEVDAKAAGQPRVAALAFEIGVKRFAETHLADAATAQAGGTATARAVSGVALPTGLTKRLEWPEIAPDVILRALSATTGTSDAMGSAANGELIAESWARLGDRGFDLGLWSLMATGQRRALQPQENEPFYQLLRVAGEGVSLGTSPLVVQDLIRQPHAAVGRAFRVQPVIKQVTYVPNQPGERGEQLGMAGYYLLHGVIQLPRPLRLKLDEDRQIDYRQHFPVIIASRELPAGMVVGDELRLWIDCEGIFFKLWGYQSQHSLEAGVTQWAPLLIAQRIELSGPPSGAAGTWPIGGLLLIPLGLSLVFLLFSGLRAQRSRSRRTGQKR